MPHNCIISGWGATQLYPPQYPKIQRWAQVKIWKEKWCRAFVGQNLISETVCAGNSEEFGARTCHGDSGGPLACVHNIGGNDAMVLVGVTRSGLFDCMSTDNRRTPSFFTRVSQYVDWIKQYMVIANCLLFTYQTLYQVYY